MAAHRYIDRICAAAAALSLLLTLLFLNGKALGLEAGGRTMGYEDRLFDTARVHTLDIVMDDWDAFLDTCESEDYSPCAVIIDGEACQDVGIRGKGNTSLSMVSRMDSRRYSFKIEFDQYDSAKSYYGLDKLCLNNIIQDNTYLKDYLTYQMMGAFGVDSPLCSFVYLTVNGEDWGLYLAVEGVEDAFLRRNYGSETGALYKPDSTGFGAGRGNGRDFDPDQFQDQGGWPQDNPGGQFPQQGADTPGFEPGARPDRLPSGGGEMGPGGGMGSEDVKLQYIDDDPDSYPNLFDNAKTQVTQADQLRLIASLKALSACEDLEQVLDVDEVLRYFVVHNFVVNGDSYTGSMIHNYYLREHEGRLSMIPWDYNLAFGTFMGGSASSSVNEAIEDVLSDRPMQSWIFSDEAYTRQYRQLYTQFLDSVDIGALIDQACALIAPYVEKDPTSFCTYEDFQTGVEALKTFCALREESVRGQLDGTIPSTSEGQREDPAALVDTGALDLSDMGTMNTGGGMGGGPGGFDGERTPQAPGESGDPDSGTALPAFRPEDRGDGNFTPPGGSGPAEGSGAASLSLAGISAAVLLAGLILALKFRR